MIFMKKQKVFFIGLSVLISVSIFLSARNAYGEDPENFAPTIMSVFLNTNSFTNSDSYESGTIDNLVASGTLDLFINGMIQDLNGSGDVVSVSAVFHRSGAPVGVDCAADNNFCYRITSCSTQTTANPYQLDYSCPLSVWYYADATVAGSRYESEDWRVFVKAEDSLTYSFNNFFTKEMSKLLALNIPDNIYFGSRSLGSITTSENNTFVAISQNGNVLADVEVSANGPLICSENGEIPLENQAWAISDMGFVNSTILTAQSTDTNLGVLYQDDDSLVSSKNLYWNISIPASSLRGTCSGVTTITAIEH